MAAAVLGGAQPREAVARLALHLNGVDAGHEAGEGVFAPAVGGGVGDGLAGGVHGIDPDAGEALVLLAQHAVVARVLKHHAADGRDARHAHQRGGFAAAAQREAADGELPPRGPLFKAVDLGCGALGGHGEDGAVVRQNGAQLVVAAAQALQAEGAVLAGFGLALGFGAAPAQGLHRHPGIARLALVQAAVIVQIQKRHAADDAVFHHADVLVHHARGVAHGKLAGDVGAGEDAAQIPAGLRIAGIEHAIGQSGGNGVHVVGQEVEEVLAGFIGGDFAHRARAVALDAHGHARHAGVAVAHDAVVVHVLKHPAAQRAHGGHGQGESFLLAGGEGNVQIDGAALHAPVGYPIARGQRHADGVAAGARVERRLSVAVGGGGIQRRFSLQQRHLDAGHPAVVVAALAVAVAVLKNGQRQPGGGRQAHVAAGYGFPLLQRHRIAHDGAGLRRHRSAHAHGVELLPAERADHAVFARRKAREGILAVQIGLGARRLRPRAAVAQLQPDGHARDELLAFVMDKVFIGVHIGAARHLAARRAGRGRQADHRADRRHGAGGQKPT